MPLTTVTATYAAIVATVALIWNIRNALRDVGCLKVHATFMKKVGDAAGRTHLVVMMTNVGRRPLTAKLIAGRYRHARNGADGFLMQARDLPKEIKESEQHAETSSDFSSLFEDGGISSLYVADTHGREWKVSTKNLKQLAKDYRREAGAGAKP